MEVVTDLVVVGFASSSSTIERLGRGLLEPSTVIHPPPLLLLPLESSALLLLGLATASATGSSVRGSFSPSSVVFLLSRFGFVAGTGDLLPLFSSDLTLFPSIICYIVVLYDIRFFLFFETSDGGTAVNMKIPRSRYFSVF